MLQNIDIEQVLLLDIETVPQYASYDEVPEHFKNLWQAKIEYTRKETPVDEFYEKAGIWAEFGKIICISIGRIKFIEGTPTVRLKSFSGKNEIEILKNFSDLLYKIPNKVLLCAHNGKEFDFPYLCRRLIINNLQIPPILNTSGKKPWEVPHLDTLEMWKFGDYKHYTSLNLLASVLNINTPKDDLDGSMVRDVYYQEDNLPRIVHYCQKDVVTIAQILLKLKGLPNLTEENINIVS